MEEEAYSRTKAVLGETKVNKIKNSHVLIAGLGGVGGYALEALARMGVGSFTLIDSDVFELSNLNRQILSLSTNIGQDKVEVAKERVLLINPDAKVNPIKAFIDKNNIDGFLKARPDAVIDAIDSVESKCILLAKCIELGIPVFSSMGAARRLDPTQVKVADISKTYGCPLAKSVRNGLRNLGITVGVESVFSPEKIETSNREVLGSLSPVVGTFGLALASLAVKSICKTE